MKTVPNIEKSDVYTREMRLIAKRNILETLKDVPEYEMFIDTFTKQTIFEKTIEIITSGSIKTVKLLYYCLKIIGTITMNSDLKTTILGVITGIIGILGVVGLNIAPELQTEILTLAGSVISILIMLLAKETNKENK